MASPYVSTREIAAVLGTSQRTAARRVDAGLIPSVYERDKGGHRRVPREMWDRFVAASRCPCCGHLRLETDTKSVP